MSNRKYSDDQIEKACDLLETGRYTYAQIAEETGMHRSSVYHVCLAAGADLPSRRQGKIRTQKTMVVQIGDHTRKLFTPEEDKRMVEMALKGAGPSKIGRELGRKHNSIIARLRLLARHDARAEGE